MKRFNRKILMFVFIVSLIATMLFWGFSKNNEVEALSKYGSRGDEVKQIQQKLKNWGYYNGSVDGIYGSKTLEAVKYFQRKNGLTVDGIAGDKTLAALGIRGTSNSSSSSSNSNSNNVTLLAKLIYGESRGEPYTGRSPVWDQKHQTQRRGDRTDGKEKDHREYLSASEYLTERAMR